MSRCSHLLFRQKEGTEEFNESSADILSCEMSAKFPCNAKLKYPVQVSQSVALGLVSVIVLLLAVLARHNTNLEITQV